jgi:hypothetical protein
MATKAHDEFWERVNNDPNMAAMKLLVDQIGTDRVAFVNQRYPGKSQDIANTIASWVAQSGTVKEIKDKDGKVVAYTLIEPKEPDGKA